MAKAGKARRKRSRKNYGPSALRRCLKQALAARDGLKCALCGQDAHSVEVLSVDHRHALSLGGENHFDNLQLAHPKCNEMKGWKEWREATRLQKRLLS